MNEENKRTFTIAVCITTFPLILMSINEIRTESLIASIIVRVFLIATLIVTAFLFVYSVENKVKDEEEEGDEVDEQ